MNKIEIEQKLSAIEKQIAGLQAEQEDLKNLIQNMPDDVQEKVWFCPEGEVMK